MLRYGYFVVQLRGGVPGFEAWGVPRWVVWARYNSFWALYPVGIVSECVLVWRGSCAVGEGPVRWALRAVLGAYVPGMSLLLFLGGEERQGGLVGRGRLTVGGAVGSYVLYTHMMRQRRKVMRGKEVERGR